MQLSGRCFQITKPRNHILFNQKLAGNDKRECLLNKKSKETLTLANGTIEVRLICLNT